MEKKYIGEKEQKEQGRNSKHANHHPYNGLQQGLDPAVLAPKNAVQGVRPSSVEFGTNFGTKFQPSKSNAPTRECQQIKPSQP
jgi:hypothetical protein